MAPTQSTPQPPSQWSVVVPVKRLPQAKSRLAPLAGSRRAELALAVCLDTVGAALACAKVGQVVVVTDDATAAAALRRLPRAGEALVITADRPDSGLNPALRHGAKVALQHHPTFGVAAVSADLPALRGQELARVLTAAAAHEQAFLADAAGIGTTVYAVGRAAETTFSPGFGGQSRQRHLNQGALEVDLAGLDSVRQDVDTQEDLRAAMCLGVGAETARLLVEVSPDINIGANSSAARRR